MTSGHLHTKDPAQSQNTSVSETEEAFVLRPQRYRCLWMLSVSHAARR